MKKFLIAPVLAAALMAAQAPAPQTVTLPGQSPLVTFRIVFRTGAASDPAGKPGAAALTAAMLAQGGTREMTYKQILDAMFPMATHVSSQVDKEMTTFSGTTHIDNLNKFYSLFKAMLLDPGWREDDFQRLREDAINYLRVSLRGNNDEELGKEVLYNTVYAGHPYGWDNEGTVSSLQKLTLDDLKAFYRQHYTQANLIIGLAGGYPPEFLAKVKKDFAALPEGKPDAVRLPEPKRAEGLRVTIVDKPTRSVAYSIGFPIDVKRGDPDYPALLVASSYFGQHRISGGRLYTRMRELRGLNYGDYSYIEYFPRGMFQFEPDPNLARRQQIFQMWIRPVEPATAHFALRLAMYELDNLIKNGLDEQSFERTRTFVSKYVNLLTSTKNAELGYLIDSRWYGTPEYTAYVRNALAKLTREDVNRAIRKHLRTTDLDIVVVTSNAKAFAQQLISNEPSPMKYNSPKPENIMNEDKTVERWKLDIKPENVHVIPVDKVFE